MEKKRRAYFFFIAAMLPSGWRCCRGCCYKSFSPWETSTSTEHAPSTCDECSTLLLWSYFVVLDVGLIYPVQGLYSFGNKAFLICCHMNVSGQTVVDVVGYFHEDGLGGTDRQRWWHELLYQCKCARRSSLSLASHGFIGVLVVSARNAPHHIKRTTCYQDCWKNGPWLRPLEICKMANFTHVFFHFFSGKTFR